MTILLVEDNEKMRLMIRKILARSLNDIESFYECDDGDEAIKLYKKFLPDWVLLDIQLKQNNGLAAARMIKKLNHDVNIIIVTQYDDLNYMIEAKALGAVGFVLKDNLMAIVQIIQKKSNNQPEVLARS